MPGTVNRRCVHQHRGLVDLGYTGPGVSSVETSAERERASKGYILHSDYAGN